MKSQAPAATAASTASKIDLTWAVENQPVWIMLPEDDPSGEACAKGTIIKLIDDENAQIQMEGVKEPKAFKGDKIYPLNNYKEYPEGYDDMVDMENLSEAELLNNLQMRFKNDMIYTYVGPTLIVMNPYKRIEKLVDVNILKNFQKRLMAGQFEQKEMMPHVFAISGTTLKNMFENRKNQAIVISGESGAGKTENTKSAMKFLTSLGKSDEESKDSKEENIEDKILACNPVLEAFGNSKTVRNDNSSRFGKYVSLLVEKDTKKIIGATITNYLLEKSRVVGQTSEERNYHIFYAFLRGASPEALKGFFLTNKLDDWEYLKNSFQGEVPTVPDVDLYKEVTDSFNTMNFSKEEQNAVWTYTAAALMVGNLDFDESTFTDTLPCKIKNEEFLQNAAKIMNLNYETFAKSLRFKTRVIGNQAIDSTIKREECLIFRDSLAKDLFNKLFNWLVRRLNFTVMPPEFTKGGLDMTALMNKYYHIGLLDIFGFEIFKVNSLEQFCINFSNEKLQQLYIAYVFKGEEREFINEGLKDFLGELNFKDNQHLIEMLDSNKLPGIFQSVDESCSVTATDQNLYDKIVKQLKKPEFPFATPKIARDTFIIKHTAKEVEYNINGFRAKNKDEISKTIEDAICASTNPHIVNIWKCLCLDEVEPEDAKKAKPNPKDKFLGFKFRMQMKELMEELNSCECHFIRCLKPNEKKQKDFFLPQLVLQQIKYMGILDTIKVRKDSFPIRTPYKFFYEKYQELDKKLARTPFDKHVADGADFKEFTKMICNAKVPHLGTQMLLYGTNKLFLRVEAAKEIEKVRRDWEALKRNSAKKIQRAWFRYKKLKLIRAMFAGMRKIQQIYKIKREYLRFTDKRRMARRLQKWWRKILWQRKVERVKKFAIKIQNWWKKMFYQAKYKRILESSKEINRLIRGGKGRKTARGLRLANYIVELILNRGVDLLFEKVRVEAAICIQRHTRGFLCRKRMKDDIERIRKAKEDFVYNKNATIIQKNARAFIVRSTFKRLYGAAIFIQGYMKMRWLSTLFQRLRTVSIKIQKAVKRWYIRRKVINDQIQKFMNSEGRAFQNLQLFEQANFFGAHNLAKQGPNYPQQPTTSRLNNNASQYMNEGSFYATHNLTGIHHASQRSMMSDTFQTQGNEEFQYTDQEINPQDAALFNLEANQNFLLNAPKEMDPYGSKKIQLFTKILDIDVLSDTSLIYDPMWSLQILNLQNDIAASGNDIQIIEVGQAHTTAIPSSGKMYSFGWNDFFQLGRPTPTEEHVIPCAQINLPMDNFRPKTIATGDDHNLLLDYQGNLYIWGDNSQGQLGLGHCRQTSKITILDFLSNDSIQEVKAKGNKSLVVTQSGKVFAWPIQLNSGEKIFKPAELFLPPRIHITTASCGYNFTALVSKNGLLFTYGKDNMLGQLGHGDNMARETPTQVEALKGEIVIGVSCGYKHVVCKTKLGRAYTWGWGKKGQLGHGALMNISSPKMVEFNQNGSKAKVLQVQAGYSHSVMVLDNKKVMWWGSNASLENQASPIEIDLHKKIPGHHKDFTTIRVLCSWSKSMSLTYISMADTRTTEFTPNIKQKILSTLTSKIEETGALNNVDLPYVESIAKHFPIKFMKNYPVPTKDTRKNASPKKIIPGQVPKTGRPPFYFESLQRIRAASPTKQKDMYSEANQSMYSPQKSLNASRSIKNLVSKAQAQMGLNNSLQYSSPVSLNQTPKGQLGLSYRSRELYSQRSRDVSRGSQSPSGRTNGLGFRLNSPERESKKSTLNTQSSENSQRGGQVESLNHKLVEIKKRMQEIIQTPMEIWSKTDAEFIKMATEPEMLELLQNVKV